MTFLGEYPFGLKPSPAHGMTLFWCHLDNNRNLLSLVKLSYLRTEDEDSPSSFRDWRGVEPPTAAQSEALISGCFPVLWAMQAAGHTGPCLCQSVRGSGLVKARLICPDSIRDSCPVEPV